MNYFPFHIGDYLSATRHLSWDEDAAYRRLLDAYYTSEKPLPTDLRQVFRLVVASTETQREAVETVLKEFFELTDSGWVNRRAERELDAMRDKQQKQRDKANKRWQKPAGERSNASAMPVHVDSDAAASEKHADAMPPTPTPTPTPKKEEKKETRKRDLSPSLVVRPDGVSEGVWVDWLALRRKKSAPVTPTVLQGAEAEARKAGMSLDAFWRIWCTRGSQGLQADWLKPSERPQPVATRHDIEPEWRRRERERNEAFLGPAAIRRTDPNTIEAQIRDITPDLLTGS